MAIKFKNRAKSKLLSGISPSDTTLTVLVGDGDKFPALGPNDYFMATIVATDGTTENVKVTARVGDVFTIERGQEGSSPALFFAGARIGNRLTAGSIEEILNTAFADANEIALGESVAEAISPKGLKDAGILMRKLTNTFTMGTGWAYDPDVQSLSATDVLDGVSATMTVSNMKHLIVCDVNTIAEGIITLNGEALVQSEKAIRMVDGPTITFSAVGETTGSVDHIVIYEVPSQYVDYLTPVFFDVVGTASTYDVGTAPDQIPTNADIVIPPAIQYHPQIIVSAPETFLQIAGSSDWAEQGNVITGSGSSIVNWNDTTKTYQFHTTGSRTAYSIDVYSGDFSVEATVGGTAGNTGWNMGIRRASLSQDTGQYYSGYYNVVGAYGFNATSGQYINTVAGTLPNGVVGTFAGKVDGTVLKIERVDGTIKYYRNGVLEYTAPTPDTADMRIFIGQYLLTETFSNWSVQKKGEYSEVIVEDPTTFIPAHTSATSDFGTISASGSHGNYPPFWAFRRDGSTSGWLGLGATPWIRYVFTTPQTIIGYKLVCNDNAQLMSYNRWAKAWNFKVGLGAVAVPDTVADTRSNISWSSTSEEKTFMLSSPQTNVKSFEVAITQTGGATDYAGLGEITPIFGILTSSGVVIAKDIKLSVSNGDGSVSVFSTNNTVVSPEEGQWQRIYGSSFTGTTTAGLLSMLTDDSMSGVVTVASGGNITHNAGATRNFRFSMCIQDSIADSTAMIIESSTNGSTWTSVFNSTVGAAVTAGWMSKSGKPSGYLEINSAQYVRWRFPSATPLQREVWLTYDAGSSAALQGNQYILAGPDGYRMLLNAPTYDYSSSKWTDNKKQVIIGWVSVSGSGIASIFQNKLGASTEVAASGTTIANPYVHSPIFAVQGNTICPVVSNQITGVTINNTPVRVWRID